MTYLRELWYDIRVAIFDFRWRRDARKGWRCPDHQPRLRSPAGIKDLPF